MKIDFFKHNIDNADIERAVAVLRSIFLTTGESVAEFETKLGEYLGGQHVVGVTSCTAALHLALLAWGIGDGDEVITTPMSFCATSNSVLHAGATPVFADVEASTGNLDANLIESAITDKTKCIMPVHLYGQMCDMRAIRRVADKHGLIVIEDAAHCIEGVRDGVRVGELGDAACFSFYATKNITSGEGGAVSVKDAAKADLLKMLRSHGIDRTAADRYTKLYNHWDMPFLGWKYNMDNIHASLLLGQLGRIDALRERRDDIHRRYEKAFDGVKGIRLIKDAPGSKSARHLFTILVEESRRDSVLHALQQKGVGVAVNYRPIHFLRYYRENFGYNKGDFPVAEEIGACTITLPLYAKLTDAEIDYVIKNTLETVKV